MQIKAIETHYKGWRFRSRQEARWAVFLDALGIAWEYEREGYELGEAGRYLPDFWLPDFERFLEIKPQHGKVLPEEWKRARALAAGTEKIVLVFYECAPAEMILKWPDGRNSSPDTSFRGYGNYVAPDGEIDGLTAFGFCRWCKQTTIGFHGLHWLSCAPQYEKRSVCGRSTVEENPTEDTHILRAFAAARSARFEHGQSVDPWKELR